MFKKIYVYLLLSADMQINAPHLGTNLTGEYTLNIHQQHSQVNIGLKNKKKIKLSVMDIPQRMCVCMSVCVPISVCILVVSFIKRGKNEIDSIVLDFSLIIYLS